MTKERYWWPSLKKDIKDVITLCWQGAQFNMIRLVTLLRPIKTQYHFEIVTIDTGHITILSGRKEYFLVAVDSFTKWVEV